MIEERLKQRLVGAVVLTTVAVIFIPMAFQERPKSEQAPVTKSQARFTASGPSAEHPPLPVDAVEVEPGVEPISTTDELSQDLAPDRLPSQDAGRPSKPPQAETLSDRPSADATRAGWVVQLASFSREANAKSLRAKLVAQGFAAFIEKTASMYRVRVGPTSGQQKARALRAALKQAVNLQGVVVRYP
ncbi:MAG: SPOR domain-containing protein [Gammaproteobacteria bacterium]